MSVYPARQDTVVQVRADCAPRTSAVFSGPTVLAFFALAFNWSWGLGIGARCAMTLAPVPGTTLEMASGFGPSIAGTAVDAWGGPRTDFRDWFARCLTWRIDWRWYAAAFGLPPAIMLLALVVHDVLGIIPTRSCLVAWR
jgi:uncharacterized protein